MINERTEPSRKCLSFIICSSGPTHTQSIQLSCAYEYYDAYAAHIDQTLHPPPYGESSEQHVYINGENLLFKLYWIPKVHPHPVRERLWREWKLQNLHSCIVHHVLGTGMQCVDIDMKGSMPFWQQSYIFSPFLKCWKVSHPWNVPKSIESCNFNPMVCIISLFVRSAFPKDRV